MASEPIAIAESDWRYPGWKIVLISHIGVLVGFATVFIYSFTLMVKPLQQEFGWNREQIARAFSLAAISVAIVSPFMGRLVDRVEPRKVIAAFMVMLGLGLASLSTLNSNLTRFYATAVFIGIAGSGTYQLGYARIVASWFERRLGAALSIVVAGSGLGSLILPPIAQRLITVYGWRHTYLILGALPFAIGAPLTFLFAPSSRGTHRQRTDGAGTSLEGSGWKQAIATRSFLLLALGVCCVSLTENGALAHLAPMMSDRGLTAVQAAYIVSILGGSSLAGRLLLGWLLDYVAGAHIAVFSLLATGIGVIFLAHTHSFGSAAPWAFVAGLGMGSELDLIPYMLKRYFGMRSFSALYGLVYSVFAVAGAIAPLVLGHVYDTTGSYTGAISILAGSTTVIAFCMFALPAYKSAPADHSREVDSEVILT